jgi:hypothetical protein
MAASAVKTAQDYQHLILEDILDWYKGLPAPTAVPGYDKLNLLMREARVLVDTERARQAKAHNGELNKARQGDDRPGPEMSGSGVPK